MSDAPAFELIEPEVQSASKTALAITPADLMRVAIDSGNQDIERLERLMRMQIEWEGNEAKKAYNVAFAAFKAHAVRIIKNRQVAQGPLTGKKYAELFAVINAATPALSEHGLSASWKLTKDDKDWIEVTCTLKHAAGHSESVSMGGPPDVGGAKNAIQARASTVTYLERYTFKAITGLSEQDDDDDGRPEKEPGADGIDPVDQPRNLGLTPARYKIIRAVANASLQKFNEGNEWGAWEEVEGIIDNDEKQALWSIIWNHSALRAFLKKRSEEANAQTKPAANEPTEEDFQKALAEEAAKEKA